MPDNIEKANIKINNDLLSLSGTNTFLHVTALDKKVNQCLVHLVVIMISNILLDVKMIITGLTFFFFF